MGTWDHIRYSSSSTSVVCTVYCVLVPKNRGATMYMGFPYRILPIVSDPFKISFENLTVDPFYGFHIFPGAVRRIYFYFESLFSFSQ